MKTKDLKRIKKSKQIDKLIVATTEKKEDNVIVKIAQNENVEFFRGEENDVLDRYYNCLLYTSDAADE